MRNRGLQQNGEGVIAGLGCLFLFFWLLWVSFIVFCVVMVAADFFDLSIAITDKL